MNIANTGYHLHPVTHLFTLRLWVEGLGEGRGEVRMQVKHILSGETRYFREWTMLMTYMEAKLQASEEAERLSGCQ